MLYLLTTAIVTGLIGSLHCVGMCGPLALGIPFYTLPKPKVYMAMLLYNLGRAISYSFLGFFVGLLGNAVALMGWLQALSITSGLIMVLLAVGKLSFFTQFKWTASFHQSIINHLSKSLQQHTFLSFLKIGLLNGLLPCGLIYMALLTSLVLANAFKSMLFMFIFGIGTIPLMLGLLLLNYRFSLQLKQKLQKIIPVFAICMGCLLILRGLNLNIPFISPQFMFDAPKAAVGCH